MSPRLLVEMKGIEPSTLILQGSVAPLEHAPPLNLLNLYFLRLTEVELRTGFEPAKNQLERLVGLPFPQRSMERIEGIEPSPSVWKTEALPLCNIRMTIECTNAMAV